jgi:quercetin dioxygenase-like cupin family protein
MKADSQFPDIIANLPQAEIPIQGLTAYLIQGSNQQVVFMAFENAVAVSEHTHEAQWGIVIDGEIELTIDGNKMTYKKGDTYFIPKNITHSANIKAGYKDLTIFNQKDRYKAKNEKEHTRIGNVDT